MALRLAWCAMALNVNTAVLETLFCFAEIHQHIVIKTILCFSDSIMKPSKTVVSCKQMFTLSEVLAL